jgi:hypothetical protein
VDAVWLVHQERAVAPALCNVLAGGEVRQLAPGPGRELMGRRLHLRAAEVQINRVRVVLDEPRSRQQRRGVVGAELSYERSVRGICAEVLFPVGFRLREEPRVQHGRVAQVAPILATKLSESQL